MKANDELLVQLLNTNWQLLGRSLISLQLSVKKAVSIREKDEYSFEDMETFDSLTSKFSRTSDIFLQKVLRTIWELLHEDRMPLIDMLNRAEKMGLISSSDQMLEIRDLRNQISHEYIPEAIQELIPDVIELSAMLEENIEYCYGFLQNRKWLSS